MAANSSSRIGAGVEHPVPEDYGVGEHPGRTQYARRVLLCGWMTRQQFMVFAINHEWGLPTIPPPLAALRWQYAMRDCLTGDASGDSVDTEQIVVGISLRVHPAPE